jgi:hypothetical protein
MKKRKTQGEQEPCSTKESTASRGKGGGRGGRGGRGGGLGRGATTAK